MNRSLFDHLAAMVRPALVVAGIGCFVTAAWLWDLKAGIVTAGIGLFYLDWASRS